MTKSIFELDEFKPFAARWQARQGVFATRERYYDGSVYGGTRSALRMLGPRVGSAIRPLYLPLARAVSLDAGIVPAGWKLAESAAPLETAVRTVFSWSDWRTDGQLFVLFGAEYGSVGLKISDLRGVGRVIVKPMAPTRFMLVDSSVYDSTPRMAIVLETRTGDDGKDFEYAEVIEATRIRTYADGQPRGFAADRAAEYENALGFVPFVETPFLAGSKAIGECTFSSVMPMLDEVNELASDLAAAIKAYSDPAFYVTGVEEGDLKRGDNVWYLPDATAKAGAVVAPIDVAGILAFVKEMAANVHAGLPELAFDELRNKQQIASATVQLQLMELTVKVNLVRANFDHALATALRLAGRAAKTMSQSTNEPVSQIAALDSELLAFDSEREVIPLDPESRATVAKLEAEARAAGASIVSKAAATN